MAASTSVALRSALAGPSQPSLPVRQATRHSCVRRNVTVMAKKGFGSSEQATATAPKVSKRGKVASRPGQQQKQSVLRKQEEQRRIAAEEEELAALAAKQEAEEIEDAMQASVPQVVTDRMLKRIIIFSGIPVFTGFMLYPVFYYLKVGMDIDLPMWVVYITQLLVFGGGLLGITYGVTSASWDPKREGTFLGWTEFRANLPIVLERFGKN